MADTAPVVDENLRLGALQAIFPGMRISLNAGKRIDDSWPEIPQPRALNAPDALAGENIYRVIGNATNEAEKQASTQIVTGKPSSTRLVRFRLFPWPDRRISFIAVLQYNFEDVIPADGLPLDRTPAATRERVWKLGGARPLFTRNHVSLFSSDRPNDVSRQWRRRTGRRIGFRRRRYVGHEPDGLPSGPQNRANLLETTSQPFVYKTDEMFTQTLDLPRTIDLDGKQVCFTKTAMFENGQLPRNRWSSPICVTSWTRRSTARSRKSATNCSLPL